MSSGNETGSDPDFDPKNPNASPFPNGPKRKVRKKKTLQTGGPSEDDRDAQAGAPSEHDRNGQPNSDSGEKNDAARKRLKETLLSHKKKRFKRGNIKPVETEPVQTAETLIELVTCNARNVGNLEINISELKSANSHLQEMLRDVKKGAKELEESLLNKDTSIQQYDLKVNALQAEKNALQADKQLTALKLRKANASIESLHKQLSALQQRAAEQLVDCAIQSSDGCDFGDRKVPLNKALTCNNGHIMCLECVQGVLHAHADKTPAQLKSTKGNVRCPAFMCQCTFTAPEIAKVVTNETFEKYFMKAMNKLIETTCFAIADKQNRDEMAALEQMLKEKGPQTFQAERLVYHFQNELFLFRCPNKECLTPFADFTGCMALECRACPNSFCAWCMKVFGTSTHIHRHIRDCEARPPEQLRPEFPDHRDIIPQQQLCLRIARVNKEKQKWIENPYDWGVWTKALKQLSSCFEELGRRHAR